MQKIFYNANVITFNDSAEIAEAFLVNDGALVLVGSNKEVLEMKMEDTETIDLQGKTVIPTFFNTNSRIFNYIENKLKNAKPTKKTQKNEDLSEDFEKFCNFEKYLKEFLQIQEELIKNGITTILEQKLSRDGFVFWKKVAESGKLKIDVIAYVDFITSKAVMDNNCRSYRKYKDHLRLGGYTVSLDGDLLEKQAWLKKTYKSEKGYIGYPAIFDEQLAFLLKTSLEEKKQLVVFATGDNASDQFVRCYKGFLEKEKPEDKYRPVLCGCELATKAQLNSLKEFEVVPNFDVSLIKNNSLAIKQNIGRIRLSKTSQVQTATLGNLNFTVCDSSELVPNVFDTVQFLETRISVDGIQNKKQTITRQKAFENLLKTSAQISFDGEQKGSLESGKNASFLVLSNNILSDDLSSTKVEKVYVLAEELVIEKAKSSKQKSTKNKQQKK